MYSEVKDSSPATICIMPSDFVSEATKMYTILTAYERSDVATWSSASVGL